METFPYLCHPKNENDVDVGFHAAALAGRSLYQLARVVPAARVVDMEDAGRRTAGRLVPVDVCRHLALYRPHAHDAGRGGL